ncbi:MAG: hypothetical protein WDM79_00760 [Terricaulis sp.]
MTVALFGYGVASAQAVGAGTYLCTTEQRASIGTTHLEGAGPPEASASTPRYRFRLHVTEHAGSYRVVEVPYEGPDQSPFQWEDDNSTLHSAYVGDGRAFHSEDGPGFLNFNSDAWGPALQFHHAGYEYAGGEDRQLSVRWGRCVAEG